MKSVPSPVSMNLVEPLEGRIAPAVMHIGATGTLENFTDTEYHEDITAGSRPDAFDDLNFIDTGLSADQISLAVNVPHTANSFFYVRLDAGDRIQRLTDVNNYQDLISVRSGSAIAYFTDLNGDNEYNDGEFTGLSLSANAVVDLNGSIGGDIVTNLNLHGTKAESDDTVDMSSLVGPKQGIKSLNIGGGSVAGSVLSGGDISSLLIVGGVESVLAGAAANGHSFDFFASKNNDDTAGQGTVVFQPGVGVKGASIRNVEISSLTGAGVIAAGAGGAGAAGGSLSNIRITGDFDGFSLLAGRGGDADTANGRLNGGAGGGINKILVAGLADSMLNDVVLIKAGDGGDGATTGKGGAGGSNKDIRVGFEINGGVVLASENLLSDNIHVVAGAGGSGKIGGAGGRDSAVKLRASTPDQVGGNVEISVIGGAGGASVSPGGKAGVGGGLDNIEVRNQTTAADTDILIQAGAGGNVQPGGGASTGAAGGAIKNLKVLGSEIQVVGGDGSSGKTGGKGGSLSNVTVLDDDSIFAQSILFYGGRGGDGSAGNAGAGGDLTNMQVPGADLQAMLVNPAVGGNGGNSIGGKGGKGGNITNLVVSDIDSSSGAFGTFDARAGLGGDGDTGGGAGGSIKTLTLDGVDLNTFVVAGSGGNALVSGNGGAGGSMTAAQIVTYGVVNGSNVTGTISSGKGGNAAGTNKAGGKGGDIRSTMLALDGDATLPLIGDGLIMAGDGGNGSPGTGAAGSGGSIFSSAVFVSLGSATITAGDAGTVGGKAGNGGSLTGTTAVPIGLRGNLNITASAGDGSFGGAGGNISNLSFGNGTVFSDPLSPTPSGTILIKAGTGSQGLSKAGRGGSLSNVNGGVSSGANQLTTFLAGDGGGDVRTSVSETTTGSATVHEVQTLNVVNTGPGTFTLSFDGQTTTPISTRLPGETDAAFADRIETALNGLSTLGSGAVSVSPSTEAGSYAITFTAFNDQVLVNGQTAFIYTGTGKSAAGGSITNVTLSGGGAVGGLITFEAGDGGNSGSASTGVAGGTIKGVGASDISPAAVLRSFGAGDGGDALRRGGTGGSVLNVEVLGHDIGVRTGLMYGYDQMGGIFAGLGGLGVTAGKAGSVDGVSADSIAAIVAGKGSAPQLAEKIGHITLNGSNQLLFRNSSFTPGSKFQLTYNGVTTPELPGNATAQQLADALNLLPGIADAGGITVLTFTSDGGYVVQFGAAQTAKTDASLTAAELEAALETLPTVQAKGGVTTSDQPDGIHIRIGTDPNPADDVVIPANATTVQIAAALNATAFNAFGAFSVTQASSGGIPGDYTITYKTNGFGDQQQITGVENVPVSVLQKLQGAIAQIQTSEALAGQFGLTTTESRSGSDPVSVQETVRGEFFFAATELVTGLVPTDAEVQQFTLNPVNGYPTAVFTLTFNNDTTALLATSGSDTNIALAVDSALEALPSIQALTGPVGDKVQVTVSQAGPRTFNVTFGTDDGDVNQMQGSYLLPETQRIELGSLSSIPGSTYQLSFGASTTASLASNATPAQIDQALELLTDIQALPGTLGNKVSVSQITLHTFDITFNSNGDKPSFSGATSVPEIQILNLASVLAVPGGTIRLNFDGATTYSNETTPLPPAMDIVLGPTDAVTATNIATALNSLESVKATGPGNTGSVTVTPLGAGQFAVNFLFNGEQNNIVATALVNEVQHLDLNSINTIANSEFTLSVKTTVPVLESRQYFINDLFSATVIRNGQLTDQHQGSPLSLPAGPVIDTTNEFPTLLTQGLGASPEKLFVDRTYIQANFVPTGRMLFTFQGVGVSVPANATPAVIDNAIESIIGAFDVTVNQSGNSFTVTFSTNGDKPNLAAFGIVPEVQQIDLTKIQPASSTVLDFQGQDTIVLDTPPALPTPAAVQNALNALPSIQAFGNVTVTSAGGNLVNVTFGNNTLGTAVDVPTVITGSHEILEQQTLDLTRLSGTGATFTLSANGLTSAPLADTATAAQIQAALDAFFDDGSGLNGTNDILVTQDTPTVFTISFTTLRGDIPLITAQATLGLGKTARLPGSATAADIDAALDAITVGGVTVSSPGLVAGVPVTGSFDIKFGDRGDQPTIIVDTYVHEVQTIDVYDVGQFTLRLGNQSTGPLDPPVVINDPLAPTAAELTDLNAKAQSVEDALNALPGIQAIGLVDVTPASRSVVINGVSKTVYDNTAFDVTFHGDGDQNSLAGLQPEIMPVATTRQGSVGQSEQQTIRYFAKNSFDPAAYASANLVGAITDIDEHNANMFHFVNVDGSVDVNLKPTFTLGDRPLDGIVMAKFFDQATVNFTPEARLTASGFFDNDNLL